MSCKIGCRECSCSGITHETEFFSSEPDKQEYLYNVEPDQLRGKKYNKGKPPLSLIDGEFLLGMAQVLAFGAEKYDKHNWRLGIPVTETWESMQRHGLKYNDGQDLDEESKLNHLFHVAVNAMMTYINAKYKPEMDDRYKK